MQGQGGGGQGEGLKVVATALSRGGKYGCNAMTLDDLRPYQGGMLTGVSNDLLIAKLNRLLCKSPTGTGKTVTFAAIPKWPALKTWVEQFPKRGATMLVIAHREELLDQAQDKISKANPGLIVTIEQGDRHASRYSDIVIASIQTLAASKFRRLKKLMQYHSLRVVVCDEAHHASASTYRTTFVHLGFLPPADASEAENIEAPMYEDVALMQQALVGWDAIAPKDRVLIGVTATPNRSDSIGLGCVFQKISFSYELRKAIDDGWLVPIMPWVVESRVSLDNVRTSHGEFNQRDLADAVNTENRNLIAIAAWREHAEHRPTLAFTVDVAHAHALAEAFQAQGYRAAAVSGETPKEDRRATLRGFQEGTIDVVTNCMVLTEGTDLPRCSCILHTKPTKSATLYEQMTGRGLRLFPGKADCVVIDIVDIARRHSLQTAPVLYGLPPSLQAKGKVLKLIAEEYEALIDQYPQLGGDAGAGLTLEQLHKKATTFDLWTVPALGDFGTGLTMNWIKTGDDAFRTQYPWGDGTETMAVTKDMIGKFDLSLTLRPKDGGAVRQRTLGSGMETAAEAASMAEVFVMAERRSVMKLKDKDAPWRRGAPSSGQLSALARFGVTYSQSITKGEASDLIDLAKARRGR